MFVSDNPLLNGKININVLDSQGSIRKVEVSASTTIEQLKEVAVKHFLQTEDVSKSISQYRILQPNVPKCLSDSCTVGEENLCDESTVMLICKKERPSEAETIEREGPCNAEILEKTEGISPKNVEKVVNISSLIGDFQTDFKQVLISLVEAASKILCNDPQAAAVVNQAQKRLEIKLKPKLDHALVRQLVEMGFPESHAMKALHHKRMNPNEAMEWLLDHDNDPDIDAPIDYSALPAALDKLGVDLAPQPASSNDVKLLLHEKVQSLINGFKAAQKKDFRPNVKVLQNLLEMGFQEVEAVEALQISSNNQDGALDWLLSGRRPPPDTLEVGLDPTSSLYQSILNDPVIQLGLSKPKTLAAFLSMLETPSSAHHWMNDPDTTPILSTIFRIYHAEKHSPGSSLLMVI